jgi:hypothetical protein
MNGLLIYNLNDEELFVLSLDPNYKYDQKQYDNCYQALKQKCLNRYS